MVPQESQASCAGPARISHCNDVISRAGTVAFLLPAAMGAFRVLPGFDHALRGADQHVPDILLDTISAWIQGLKRS